ncbi:putative 3'-5' exoribonuclease YhaM [groundwater metagenome]|uniref:Putative 3'-5' exoribonuclease YhaM n=1 Tax=groundwater metagenome TaxID=717931 RepID=A0A098EAI5_9ZZZZ
MEKNFIRDIKNLKAGSKVEGFFAVGKKDTLQSYKNKPGYYFKIDISDKTGNIKATFWGREIKEKVEEIYNSFNNGDVVFVSGNTNLFNNEPEIHTNQSEGILRKAAENEYNAADFLPSTNQNIEEMEKEFGKTIDEIKNKFLKELLLKFFDDKDFIEKFKKWPGAMKYHHACVGGLMEHTLEVVRLCKAICDIHPTGMNKDLTIAGAILHDIGKIETITVRATGYPLDDNAEDVLRGHISIAEEMLIKEIGKINEGAKNEDEKFPEILKHKLLHIILSHHGNPEQGSVIEPAIPEAAAVYAADYFSSSVTQYIRAINDDTGKTKTKYVYPIKRVYIEKNDGIK